MKRVIFGAWIPRSYLHVFEIKKKISKIPLKISNISLNEGICFDILENGMKIKFSLDSAGLYTLRMDVKEVKKEFDFLKELLVEKIIANCHSVTYKQIKSGSLPLAASVIILSDKEFFDVEHAYDDGCIIYLKRRKEDTLAEQLLSSILFGQFLYRMMDRMELLYHSSEKVSRLLESQIDIKTLRLAIVEVDLIEKSVVEGMAKIKQLNENFNRKKEEFERLSKRFSGLSEVNIIRRMYNQVSADKVYIEELWAMLINFLEKIDTAADARLSYQESLESVRIESLLTIEAASQVAPMFVGIFLTEFYGIGGVILALGFFVLWFMLMQLIRKLQISPEGIKKIGLFKKG